MNHFHVYDGKGVYVGRRSDGEPTREEFEAMPIEKNPEGFDVLMLTGGPLDREYRIVMLDGETWFPETDADVQAGLAAVSG
jgi:hypothetical protein